MATQILTRNEPRGGRIASATVGSDTAAPLAAAGTRLTFRRGQTIFYEGDAADTVYRVVSGAVRTSRLMPDGRRYVADFLFPGDFFGLSNGAMHTTTAEALCDAIILRYPRRLFEGALEVDRQLGRTVFAALCGGLSHAHERMLLLGRKTAVERVASFLLMMAARAEDNQVNLLMSRGDIADYLGLTIETVSRVLSQLKAQGVIHLSDPTRIAITRPSTLRRIAEGGVWRAQRSRPGTARRRTGSWPFTAEHR